MNPQRKLILIIAMFVIALGIIVSVIAFFSQQPKPTGAYLETAAPIVRDEDTGELVTFDPNTIEPSEQREVIVLGLETLYSYNFFELQVLTVRDFLVGFATERLDGKYETITLRPQDIAVSEGEIRTSLRLGQTGTILPIVIYYNDTGLVRVVIEDPDTLVGGVYDSGETILKAD